MNTYALVYRDTGKLVQGTNGPFDGATLEAAEEEVLQTLTFDPPNDPSVQSARAVLAHYNMKLVSLTLELARQYEKAT